MNTTRFDRLHRIFDEAAKLDPSQWESYLANACGGDESLLNEARQLLAVCLQATPSDTTEYRPPAPARMIGPYRVLREIGSGGMGVVYLAVRDDGAFRKNVAVKLLHSHLASPDLLQRFDQERQVLANLDHPNIARILDGGQTTDGMPYYVMEFVDGQMLDRFCDSQTLDLADRIRLFQQLVRAVNYLHENLVVHRDLKPSNILVIGDGTVKLLDFGIAKVQIASQGTPDLTAPDSRMMTPKYASPEQITGAPVSKLSDIYSLGVILYELLTGRAPHATPSDKPIKDPQPPSENIREDLQRTPETTLQLRRRIMGDLDQIVLRCLRRDPRQRYTTAGALGEDLQRFLDGRSVEARKEPLPELLLRFVKRHRVAVGVCALLLLLGGVGAWQAVVAQNQARLALNREGEVNRLLDVLKGHLDQHPGPGQPIANGKVPAPLPDDVRKLRRALEQDLPAAWSRRPGLTPDRRALLDRSGAYLQTVRAYAAQNQELERELASAYQDLGKLYAEGYRDGALAAYDQSARLLSDLAGGDPAQSPLRDQWQALSGQIRALGGAIPTFPASAEAGAAPPQRTPLATATARAPSRVEPMPRFPAKAAEAMDPGDYQNLKRKLTSAVVKARIADDTMQELKANAARQGQMVHSNILSTYGQMQIALESARQEVEDGDLKSARENIAIADACATRVLKAGGR